MLSSVQYADHPSLPVNIGQRWLATYQVVAMSDEKRPGMSPLGRPPKPTEEARSRRTVTFLTDSEYHKLVDIAQRNKLSISAAAHKLLLQSIQSWY